MMCWFVGILLWFVYCCENLYELLIDCVLEIELELYVCYEVVC